MGKYPNHRLNFLLQLKKVCVAMGTPIEKEPVKSSPMSKQSIIISIVALVVGIAAVGGFYYYLDAIVPKGDPAFEKTPATDAENVAPTGGSPVAPGA